MAEHGTPSGSAGPTDTGSTDTDGRAGRDLLRTVVRAVWRTLALALTATLVQQLAFLAAPALIQRALDEGVGQQDVGRAAWWAGAVAVVACVQVVGAAGNGWWGGRAAADAAAGLRDRLAAAVARLDGTALAAFGRGDLAMRATRDADLVSDWVRGLTYWLQVVLTIVVVLPAIWALDPMLLVVALATVPFIAVGNLFFPRVYSARNGDLSTAHAVRADAVENLLSASAAVRGLGGERALVRRHHAASTTVSARTHAVAKVAADWASTMPAVPLLGIAVGLLVGGYAVLDGRTTIGGLVAFTSWMTMFSVAVSFLVTLLTERGEAKVAARRVAEVLGAPATLTEPAAPVALPARAELEVVGATAEPVGGTVIGPLDLRVGPGELVAVTGATGSGKSTLVRLLCRLADPTAGEVRLGGVDLRTATLADVRSRIVLVPQRPVVLAGTVVDNLLPAGGPADPEIVAGACAAAAFDRVVARLPEGLETELGERGSTLSGGQAQRLAVARGLCARPDVLVLDDVTSAVDATTEQAMLAGIRAWLPDAAIVAVTSRPAVLEAADRVVELGRAAVPVGEADRG